MTKLEAFQKELKERGLKIDLMRGELAAEERSLSKFVQENLGVGESITIEGVVNLAMNVQRMGAEQCPSESK